jgi:shikimate kinase
VDTDVLIQTEEGCSLQHIVDTVGYMRLREIEERVITGLTCDGHVIATGGSAVYSEKAVQHLRRGGSIVFLHVPIDTLRHRISDFATRGIARRPEQSFEDLYEERFQLYTACADITVACGDLGHDAVLAATCRELGCCK